ncbi:exonuclease [Candidatus Desantisbacteria bacterium CG07_land_8_20_14_0_80_39_15]|uniref:Exonuclease n=2 Tax=unclassified Candidatus Desantisiibacteriota TaxID=3106372 RepID=A0A2H9PBE8_9BACT|nr:MAG: exonuclease [Candidatus Desantisbacteria bacterium CG07_land_8_20_14_0_80_39_15]PIZ16105.1 MAG: exonuclease [Candidatus Desantisbacteria bacterium CG_4_10_14_0_8_um_filter_39_17]
MEKNKLEAYLDIETTSLLNCGGIITVIGIYITDGIEEKFIQLIGEEVTGDNLLKALEGVEIIYTYNGSEFDLPFIKEYIGIALADYFKHIDLKHDCWRKNLFGGLKKVEKTLGIERKTKGIDGIKAIELWGRYKNFKDEEALKTLLEYNKEDVMNLKKIKEILCK